MTERRTTYRNADGVRRTLVTDDERPEDFGVHTEQVLDEILASVERDREIMHQERTTNKLLARIPIEVYERSVHQQWDEADWARYLNSAGAAPFRIWRGRV